MWRKTLNSFLQLFHRSTPDLYLEQHPSRPLVNLPHVERHAFSRLNHFRSWMKWQKEWPIIALWHTKTDRGIQMLQPSTRIRSRYSMEQRHTGITTYLDLALNE